MAEAGRSQVGGQESLKYITSPFSQNKGKERREKRCNEEIKNGKKKKYEKEKKGRKERERGEKRGMGDFFLLMI